MDEEKVVETTENENEEEAYDIIPVWEDDDYPYDDEDDEESSGMSAAAGIAVGALGTLGIIGLVSGVRKLWKRRHATDETESDAKPKKANGKKCKKKVVADTDDVEVVDAMFDSDDEEDDEEET